MSDDLELEEPQHTVGLAIINGDYRYLLSRTWDRSLPTQVWVMLNPSTADANTDDPTIRKCVAFAKREGFGKIAVLNLFAYRATDPAELATVEDPIGPINQQTLEYLLPVARSIVFAWGAQAERYRDRVKEVTSIATRAVPQCLGVTKDGHPKHPLYLPLDSKLEPLKVAPA